MAKKSAYDKIALREILSDAECRTINDNGRIHPPSHEVYRKISNLMADKGSVITPKHVHTIINNNRAGFRDVIMGVFGIRERKRSISVNDANYSVEKCTDQSTVTLTSLTSMKLSLVISQEKWKSIKPQEKLYGKRVYWKLQEGWTDVVAEALWVQHHLDCVFTFKNQNMYLSATSKFFLTIEGYCRECHAEICCTLLKEPSKGVDVILQCSIDGIRPESHLGKKRRQLRGARRLKVADNLIDGRKDAVTWRRKEAGRIKKFGDTNPPILPSNEVVRKAKEQRLLSKYGLKFGNPSLNLLNSAEHGKFVGAIQSVGVYRFNCIYWLPEQLQIYISRCRNDPSATLAIDATGGIAKRDKSEKPHIFLYQCVLVTKEGSVPTFQMVSADQRSIIVAGFLSHILAANAPIPPIVVTDFGWSLLIAVARIFGQCASLDDYLQKCYDAIGNEAPSLPSTFLRLDVCHLSSMITRWPSLKGNDKSLVRRFYKRCVGKACQITNLEDLSYFLESVLVVALSKCIGSGPDDKLLPSVDRLHFLNNKIKGLETMNNDDEATEQCDQEDGGDTDEEIDSNPEQNLVNKGIQKPGWKSWCDRLYDAAVEIADQSSEGDTINACYSVDFAKRLKRQLLPYLPLWTAIMVPIFGRGSVTATSAAVESEFADMKNREFRGEIPMRIDRFVMQHLERIDDKIKERCKTTDVLLQSRDELSKATHNTDLNEYSGSQTTSKAEEPLNSIEVDNPNDTTLEPDNISFDVIAHNVCSTPNISVKNISVSPIQSRVPSPELKVENIITIADSSKIVQGLQHETTQLTRVEQNLADNDWNVCEDWKGLNKNPKRKIETDESMDKRRTRPTCLDNCPEWDFIKHSKTAHAPVLLNGNIAGPVRLNNQNFNVTSTCAFDSIFQVVLSGMLANKVYSESLKSSDCPIVNLAQSVNDKKKILREHYVQRAKILTGISIFQDTVTTYTRNIKRLDVECNAAHLAQYLFEKEPSYTSSVGCSCGYRNQQKYTFISVNIDTILCRGLHLMQEAIEDGITMERSCFNCKRKISCINTYGSHLVIDTTVISDPGYPNRNNIVVPRLDSIQKILQVGGKTYMVAAVVDFSPDIKHYATYGLTGEFWYKYDSLIKKRASATVKTTITPHLIVYAICSDR